MNPISIIVKNTIYQWSRGFVVGSIFGFFLGIAFMKKIDKE
jgi:hypothetical protein